MREGTINRGAWSPEQVETAVRIQKKDNLWQKARCPREVKGWNYDGDCVTFLENRK